MVAKAEDRETEPVQYNQEFGYSRKDVLLIGVGLVALGYAMYYGLQATGMEAGMAGNFTQLIIFVGLCVGWIGSYVFRVANKVALAYSFVCLVAHDAAQTIRPQIAQWNTLAQCR